MKIVVKRAEILADYAQELGVRLLVDAEQTYFQPAIRHIAVNVLMPKYNMDTPTIYNTIQCYLKVRSGRSLVGVVMDAVLVPKPIRNVLGLMVVRTTVEPLI